MVGAFACVAPHQYVAYGILANDRHQRFRPPGRVGHGFVSRFGNGGRLIVRLSYFRQYGQRLFHIVQIFPAVELVRVEAYQSMMSSPG